MQIKKKLILCLLTILSVVSSCAMAGKTPHTWHTVSSTNGTWNATLAMINESGWFISRSGESVSAFSISPDSPIDYGFGFERGADFDIAYTLTLTQSSSPAEGPSAIQFASKACVYVITAASPANPDIRPTSFNGARCDWKVVHGVGEDFMVG